MAQFRAVGSIAMGEHSLLKALSLWANEGYVYRFVPYEPETAPQFDAEATRE